MQMKIKNRDILLSHGDIESKRIVLDIAEKTLQHLDAYQRIKSIAHMEGSVLCIGEKRWDLSKKRHVYLLGAGKACNHMAMAVDEILGDYLTRRRVGKSTSTASTISTRISAMTACIRTSIWITTIIGNW